MPLESDFSESPLEFHFLLTAFESESESESECDELSSILGNSSSFSEVWEQLPASLFLEARDCSGVGIESSSFCFGLSDFLEK